MPEDLTPQEQIARENFRETWPYFWINRANAYYTMALEKRLKTRGMDAPRWRVMMSLYEKDYLSVSEIAEVSTVKLNTTTKIVQRLIIEGMVETRVRPTDKRVTEVRLTEQGEQQRAWAWEQVKEIRDQSFYNVSPAELETLNGILRKISGDLSKLI